MTRVHLPMVFARLVAAKPELWEQLELLCPEALPLAAEILDHKTIMRCVARDSKREFYTVSASAKQLHCCIPGWCSCNSYAFEVLSSRKLVCKHELAVLVATAMDDRVHTNTIDDEKWVRLQVDVGGLGLSAPGRLLGHGTRASSACGAASKPKWARQAWPVLSSQVHEFAMATKLSLISNGA